MDARGYDSVGELLSQAGCYDWGDAEEDRRQAHAQWTLTNKNLMSAVDQERMRRGTTTGTPVPANQKANIAAETAEKLWRSCGRSPTATASSLTAGVMAMGKLASRGRVGGVRMCMRSCPMATLTSWPISFRGWCTSRSSGWHGMEQQASFGNSYICFTNEVFYHATLYTRRNLL